MSEGISTGAPASAPSAGSWASWRAKRYNERSALENEWALSDLAPLGVFPAGFGDVAAFAKAQELLGVKRDGLFGPASVAALRSRGATGEGLRLVQRPQPGWGRPRGAGRHGEIAGIMFHHPVMASVDGVIRVLSNKGLSVNYIVAPDGVIYQTAPDELMTAHGGVWNRNWISVEIVNRYSPRLWRKDEAWAAPVPTGAAWGERYGWALRRSVIPDTPAAVEATAWLVAHLCARHGLGDPRWPAAGERIAGLDARAPKGEQPFNVLAHGTVQANRWDGWGMLKALSERELGRRVAGWSDLQRKAA